MGTLVYAHFIATHEIGGLNTMVTDQNMYIDCLGNLYDSEEKGKGKICVRLNHCMGKMHRLYWKPLCIFSY